MRPGNCLTSPRCSNRVPTNKFPVIGQGLLKAKLRKVVIMGGHFSLCPRGMGTRPMVQEVELWAICKQEYNKSRQ